MGLRDNIGHDIMILPTSAVMDFYFRQKGKIMDVIETIDTSFYVVEFYENPDFPDLVGVFPVGANFLKFL